MEERANRLARALVEMGVESAVIGVPDEYWGEIVKAVIVLKPGEEATPEKIIEFCRGGIHVVKYSSLLLYPVGVRFVRP
jgi:acyl-CoA synthetase (AMP-forming)/AMP-acid ligase II